MEKEIKPAYVSFEQANWLKEKRFDVECTHLINGAYEPYHLHLTKTEYPHKNSEIFDSCVSTPEQWQVVEWLRINHGIWIVVNIGIPLGNKDMYYSNIIKFGHKNKYTGMVEHKSKFRSGFFSQPQKAYSIAFDYIKENNLI